MSPCTAGESGKSSERRVQAVHSNGPQLDDEILADPEVQAAIAQQGTVSKSYDIINTDRALLGRLAGAIAKPYGDNGFKGKVQLNLRGSGGQSFGVFLATGIEAKLVGEANDYVCKGMAGEGEGGGEVRTEGRGAGCVDGQMLTMVSWGSRSRRLLLEQVD